MPDVIGVGISSPEVPGRPLAWAMARAARTGADVVLIHVLDHADDGGDGSLRVAAAHRLLAEQMRSAHALSPGTPVRARVLRGSAIWQLVAASAELDLMVVGTHKTGFIHGTLYGSGTLPLVAEAACPVVVVPAPSRGDPTGVVVGADDSGPGGAALRFAADEAASTGEELTVLRVCDAPGARTGWAWEEARRRAAEDLVVGYASAARRRHPGLRVRGRTVDGRPAPVLVAASSGSRLLVLGDAQSGLLEPLALGVVSHDVLMNIRVPTVIVHARDEDGGPAAGSAEQAPERRERRDDGASVIT